MADKIRVNGSVYSWGSITFKVAGETYTGFNSISYADKRERPKQYGMGRAQGARGRSRGKYTVDPSKIKGPKSSVQALRDALADQSSNGKSYGDVEFLVTIQYTESDESPILVELEQCVWTSNSSSESEGPDGLEEEFEIDPMRIKRNGKTLYDSEDET